jgi:serine/threonine protein kinase/tetratricopeptide (TPR) repeat protein
MSELSTSLSFGGRVDEAADQPADYLAARSLKRHLLAELQGQVPDAPVTPEDVLARWPDDPHSDPDAASVLFADYCRRRQRGEDPSLTDYEQRFPEHKDSLASLFRHHDVMRSVGRVSASGVPLQLPAVGEELFDFRLRQELGRGAFARVFLAEQADLAGRPVVLKVSEIEGDEPQTLAQLQHTHIVPIYSVHEDAPAGLRAVCMPFFGGASLSAVLRAAWADGPPARGNQLVAGLATVAARHRPEHDAPAPRAGGERGVLPLLERLSYVQAAAWVVARLAEALQHAHGRGVLHRDVKPSNVLLGGDGQPMLLDFNLAHSPANARAHATLGGTVAYMAPEHLRALASRDPRQAVQVDCRADVYSLGMVLHEMLTGRSPFDQSASYSPVPVLIEAMALERSRSAPSVRRFRPDAPWGLESIVRKCLEPDPARRYQRAEHLVDDLTRFLEDRPLRYAPELSTAERVRKWVRRHPRLTSSGSVATAAALLLALVGGALVWAQQHLAVTREQAARAAARERQRATAAGTEQALCLVNTTTDVQDHLRTGLRVCEQTLALHHVLERDDWQDDPDWDRLDADEQRRLAEDTRELLLLLASGRVRTDGDDPKATDDALALVDRAEKVRGLPPSPALWSERARYLVRRGDAAGARAAEERARTLPPASARDHYLLATTLIAAPADTGGGAAEVYRKALAHLDEALRLNPRHYWSQVQRGICHQELGEYDLAAGDFGVCIGLWPEFAWGYFNRGVTLDRLGRHAEAIADYTAAVERDSEFVPAFLNRGLARLELRDWPEALADFDAAARLGYSGAAVHAGRGGALEGLGRYAEADEAFRSALAAVPAGTEARANLLLQYGFAIAGRLPGRAHEAFREVLRLRPRHPKALYGLGMLVMGRDDDAALDRFTEAAEADRTFVAARRYRAILFARRGQFEAAGADVNWCLEREPEGGTTLYAAACVSALMAANRQRQLPSDDSEEARAVEGQAFSFLEAALTHGYGRDTADRDPDLAGIRNTPRFRELLAK